MGEGVNNGLNSDDVIYGRPLMSVGPFVNQVLSN